MGRKRICVICDKTDVEFEPLRDVCVKCDKPYLETLNDVAIEIEKEVINRLGRPKIVGGEISNGYKAPYRQWSC